MKKDIIRVGDTVKVIHPEFFIRCGYNLHLPDVTEEIIENRSEEIEAFIDSFFGIDRLSEEYKFIKQNKTSDTGEKIAKALAYKKISMERFGGRERKLFTEMIEDHKGKLFKVHGVKIHKTGTYFAPSGGYSCYDGYYDYDCGGLSNEKTHKILEIFPTRNNPIFMNSLSPFFRIEAIHVEKIITATC
jgi:hypothetical protein